MGIFDKSSSSSTTTNLTENTNKPINVQDSEGAQIYEAEGDIYSVNTDFNAIDRATELAQRSLDVGSAVFEDGQRLALEMSRGVFESAMFSQDLLADTAQDSQQLALAVTRDTHDFSGAVVDRSYDLAESFASGAKDIAERAHDSAGSFLDSALAFTRGVQDKFSNTIGSTVDALQRIGVEQNKSTDQRLAETSERTLKYALIALSVMAVGIVAFAATRK